MEEIIKQVVAKSLRKKGGNYKLSENSKQSSLDFSYANKITAKLYHYAKKNWSYMVNRKVYERLLKAIIQLVRMDEEHELGNLQLGYGNVSSLKYFRFNSKKSFLSLIPWKSEISYQTSGKKVMFTIPASDIWPRITYDPRIYSFTVRYHVLRVPFALSEEFDAIYSKGLEFVPLKATEKRTISFSVAEWDNCLILVVGAADCWFKTRKNEDRFKTANSLFMAADILEVFRIRDGRLLEDTVRTEPFPDPSEEDSGVAWD